ncbi:MAG: rhomboid family intramembrane serine protease, partial [Planctomycetes bacterium]|nr:rhomboid family intramembrane serine protease [Planctomycetota bacterium]
ALTPATPDKKGRFLSELLALDADVYRHPWNLWQLLSYGFAHSPLGMPGGIWHVGLNMLLLWMFGRVIEPRIGRVEFLLFYLLAIIFAGVVWVVAVNAGALVAGVETGRLQVIGASGAVTAVFILFVLYYPRQTVYLWGLLAVPAWLIGALIVGQDLLRAVVASEESHVAWQAHLAGAAFAFLYFRFRWNFSRALLRGGRWDWSRLRRRPRLRVHDPEDDANNLEQQADRLLAKVHNEGEQSLTARERRVLEQYSRHMRRKRRS